MNILVGYDGTEESKRGLKLAKMHAKAFNGKLLVLQSRVTSLPEKDFKKAEKEMEEIKKEAEKSGINCETFLQVKAMTPGEHIIQFAEKNKIDEIVIGFVSSAKLGKLFLGSTASYILEKTRCTVVIAR